MKWPFKKVTSDLPEKDSADARQQICIIGTQKSGTTWLRDCLNEFVPFCKPEWYYPELFDGIAKHIDIFGGSLTVEQRDAMVRSLCASTWETLNSKYPGEKSAYPCSNAFGELRPDVHPFAVRLTRKYLPQARTVVIVRDPRATFNSLRHYLEHFREGWSQEIDPTIFATNWAEQNLQWTRDNPDAVVLYEDLKNNFTHTLGMALQRLGVKHTADDILRVEGAAYNVDKLRPMQPEIYRTGTVNEWQRKVEPEISRAILTTAAPAMRELGYQIEDEDC